MGSKAELAGNRAGLMCSKADIRGKAPRDMHWCVAMSVSKRYSLEYQQIQPKSSVQATSNLQQLHSLATVSSPLTSAYVGWGAWHHHRAQDGTTCILVTLVVSTNRCKGCQWSNFQTRWQVHVLLHIPWCHNVTVFLLSIWVFSIFCERACK